jgi:hypothetical protein
MVALFVLYSFGKDEHFIVLHSLSNINNRWESKLQNNNNEIAGADPRFQVRGGGGAHLKKIAPSGGRRENFWGISCEKSRFYAKRSYFFPILGGARAGCAPPPLDPPLNRVGLWCLTPFSTIFQLYRGTKLSCLLTIMLVFRLFSNRKTNAKICCSIFVFIYVYRCPNTCSMSDDVRVVQ